MSLRIPREPFIPASADDTPLWGPVGPDEKVETRRSLYRAILEDIRNTVSRLLDSGMPEEDVGLLIPTAFFVPEMRAGFRLTNCSHCRKLLRTHSQTEFPTCFDCGGIDGVQS